MTKVRFDQIAKEVRNTFSGDKAGVPIVGLEHIIPNELLLSDHDIDTENTFTKAFKKGQILFGRRRAYQQKAAVATFDGICSGDITVIEPIDGAVCPELLPFIIQNERFFEHAVRGSAGSLSPRVKWEHLSSYEIELPSYEEQVKLANTLWAAYNLKTSYKTLLTSIDEMVKSQFIEMFGDPVTNSKGWPTKPLSEVAPESPSRHQIEGIVWNLNLDMIESNSGKVISKIYEEVNRLLSVSQFDQGNVLFSKLRPYLNKVVVPDEIGYATTELVPLRPDQELLNKFFLAHLLRGHHFVSYANAIATGTKMPRMPMNSLRSFKCILPPMELQQQFVDIAEQADKSKFELKKSIEAIDKVIKSLINNI